MRCAARPAVSLDNCTRAQSRQQSGEVPAGTRV